MSNAATIKVLKALALDFPNRTDFNKAVLANFKKIGQGAFRIVVDAGDVVVKLRRSVPWKENKFSMVQIDESNREEAAGYAKLLKKNPVLAQFVLKPTLVKLPNGHDVILMEKMDKVWGKLRTDTRSRIEKETPKLHNQIQVVQMAFTDSHDNNIGIKGNRAYLIDFNFSDTWGMDESDQEFFDGVVADMKGELRAAKAA